MKEYDLILKELKYLIKQIDELTSFDNLSSENSKMSRECRKKADKCIQQLIQTDEGIEKYKSWLLLDDYNLKWNAALNLYPLYPKECLDSLIECNRLCNDKLIKSSMEDVIAAYKKPISDNNIFHLKLKKLYKIDNLSTLNKEYSG